MLIQLGILDNRTDVPNRLPEGAANAVTMNSDIPVAHPDQTDHHADGGRFAGPIWPEKAEYLSRKKIKADPIYNVSMSNLFRQLAYFDYGLNARCVHMCTSNKFSYTYHTGHTLQDSFLNLTKVFRP
ncbi:hypothetical protein D3C71_1695570 [compost metagenome]